jgi:hypothetical protein
MALRGTLKDFGIADILQFIGQQQRSGTLLLRAKQREVRIGFREGAIVKVDDVRKRTKDLIGRWLLKAELVTQEQLAAALEKQKRTLMRLGDVLVSDALLSRDRFEQVVQLQATEVLYELFGLRAGTYHFEQGEVDLSADAIRPLRAEAVLMEGFRQLDEWPAIRKRVWSPRLAFRKLKDLPAPERASSSDGNEDTQVDFNGPDRGMEPIGEAERVVFALVQPDRDVQKLTDLSCLGHFETCKALANLLNCGYLQALDPRHRLPGLDTEGRWVDRLSSRWMRIGLATVGFAGLALVASQLSLPGIRLNISASSADADRAIQRFVARAQLSRIASALEVYRSETGRLPDKLEPLVDLQLLRTVDLQYPWHENYYYRQISDQEFILLPPLR